MSWSHYSSWYIILGIQLVDKPDNNNNLYSPTNARAAIDVIEEIEMHMKNANLRLGLG